MPTSPLLEQWINARGYPFNYIFVDEDGPGEKPLHPQDLLLKRQLEPQGLRLEFVDECVTGHP